MSASWYILLNLAIKKVLGFYLHRKILLILSILLLIVYFNTKSAICFTLKITKKQTGFVGGPMHILVYCMYVGMYIIVNIQALFWLWSFGGGRLWPISKISCGTISSKDFLGEIILFLSEFFNYCTCILGSLLFN